ncbi:HAMP domain-containing histidine kinase [Aliidiomarina halalkaliphila]|uniref:histidine kinase n=1 Tax=Aliidiomarina halalkaliphila TaxID=2593535 RepID=A0A552WZU3_9GAMM|nr:HAMP domain-containing sensor histidine kinase [Aliidiomarina halalkaliphila]TRW48341.1 HAMP domain-containing histidine kinase [Aliidiomarina halalkaliphila]
MAPGRTRWYQSLTLRLLALFWALILLTLAAALAAVLYLVRPPGPAPLAEDFHRSLDPILLHPSSVGLLQPGRLLVGQYRIVALQPAVIADSDERLEATSDLDTAALAAAHDIDINGLIAALPNNDLSTDDAPAEVQSERPQARFAPGLTQQELAIAVRIMESDDPIQLVFGERTLGGPMASNEGWVVVSRPSTAEEIAAQFQEPDEEWLPNLIVLAIGVSFLGALILGLWFVRPLRQLRNAMRQIASGSAEPELRRLPSRRDELGELARTMRWTAVELATSRDAQRRLLSDVSHELRSPLARLQVALDLMESEGLQGDRNYLQLQKDIYRLSGIIDSILWLSRLENGLDKLVHEQIAVMDILEDLQSDLYYVNEKWRGRLHLPKETLPDIDSDPVLLRLIFENLVRNGFQYGPEDGSVFVTATQFERDGVPWLGISVRDQGPGVSEEQRQKMFAPFFRGDPSRHHGAGVGLGLALCQRATAVLGGTIDAENHPEGGLQVTLELPLRA